MTPPLHRKAENKSELIIYDILMLILLDLLRMNHQVLKRAFKGTKQFYSGIECVPSLAIEARSQHFIHAHGIALESWLIIHGDFH